LAPRKAVYLVEIGNRILVVGVGTNEVNCLTVITEATEIESLKQVTQQNFPAIFNRLVHKDVIERRERETDRAIANSSKAVGDYVKGLKKTYQRKREETHGEGDDK
jgi:flagellar biogenesis protein FliO